MQEEVLRKHLNILGYKVKDVVTGFEGVATSVSFDLYGCVQAVVNPPGTDKDGKMYTGHWFDTTRLVTTDDERVMPVPGFEPKRNPVSSVSRQGTAGTAGPAGHPDFEELP